MTKRISFLFALALLLNGSAFGYSGLGHEMVGAIADKRLKDKPVAAKIEKLLDGISLERASTIADEIRGWDKRGADDLGAFHYLAHPKIDNQLRDFWRANQPTHDMSSPMPSHHWFHYTDVPVMELEKYSDGKTGRNRWDIVHMIPYCTSVLRGDTPEDNERKITKPIAIILLAHYVGDIHQPLHVGAEYFDQHGHVADPDQADTTYSDQGGNTLDLRLTGDPPNGRLSHTKKLHGFWDLDTVMALLPPVPDT